MNNLFEHSSAILSPCGLYRYSLTRTWDVGPTVCWVMLNPSTADADQDDNTIRRCIAFSQAWGCGRLVVANLFAYRATQPADMKRAADPIGPQADTHLTATLHNADRIVCAWGADGGFLGRDAAVKKIMREGRLSAWCLGLTKEKHPKHPLFLPAATELVGFDLRDA